MPRINGDFLSFQELKVIKVNLKEGNSAKAKISQHFAMLHGFLQIEEQQLMEIADEQCAKACNDVDKMDKDLERYQEQLQYACGVICVHFFEEKSIFLSRSEKKS